VNGSSEDTAINQGAGEEGIIAINGTVWFSAVYREEHYIVDIIGGITYATIAFILAEQIKGLRWGKATCG